MDALREVFEGMGFTGVKTVLASGNVVFTGPKANEATLTRRLERQLSEELGFAVPTVLRTIEDLERLVAAKPFTKAGLSPKIVPRVTFLKRGQLAPGQVAAPPGASRKGARPPVGRSGLTFPHRAEGQGFTVLGIVDEVVCSVVDVSVASTPSVMRFLEKEFGKEVTTRTWDTVQRIIKAAP